MRFGMQLIGLTLAGLGAGTTMADTLVLNPGSPTLPAMPARCNDMLNDPLAVPNLPTIGINAAALGLTQQDCIDAMSDGRDPVHVPTHGPHDHLFSVSAGSVGMGGSGVQIERIGDTLPGINPGHPSDLFHWFRLTAGATVAAPGLGWTAGSGDGDEFNTGLINGTPTDDVCAYDMATLTSPGTPPFEVYFSLAPGSPTLGALGASPADILAVGGWFGATPVIFRTGVSLGIPVGVTTDMDALTLEVINGPNGPFVSHVQFSVTGGTATGWLFGPDAVGSGADVLVYDAATASSFVGHRPIQFGLDIDDDIDALEAVVCVGDLNGDGRVDLTDLSIVLADFGCPGPNCPGDVNGDGVTDLTDLAAVLAVFGSSCW